MRRVGKVSFGKAAAFLDFRMYKKSANKVKETGNYSSDEKYKYSYNLNQPDRSGEQVPVLANLR